MRIEDLKAEIDVLLFMDEILFPEGLRKLMDLEGLLVVRVPIEIHWKEMA